MISLALLKLIACISILALAWIVGAWVILKKAYRHTTRTISVAESFTNGVFLGTALFHLLPDAQHAIHDIWQQSHYPLIYLLAALSFLGLFALEYYSDALQRFNKIYNSHYFILYLLIALFSIHSITAGIALGISSSLSNTWILLIAILAHKGCEAYALSLHISKQASSRIHQMGLLTTFAVMTPAGIALAMLARFELGTHTALAEACFNAISAGTFLYIATLHSTVGQWRQGLRAVPLLPLLAGMGVMALVAIWA